MDTPVGRELHVGERSAHLVREGGEPGWLGAELVGDSAPLQPRAFGAVISKRRLQRQRRCASTRQPNEADATPCIVRTPEAQAPQACVSTVPPKARSAQRSRICTIREKHPEIMQNRGPGRTRTDEAFAEARTRNPFCAMYVAQWICASWRARFASPRRDKWIPGRSTEVIAGACRAGRARYRGI
ncbi:hypothetical protein V1289_003353 [Bradyrhizobium sp. AZCC 2289]